MELAADARLLAERGFSRRALVVADRIARGRGTSVAIELIRLGFLDAETWWCCLADSLGLDYHAELELPPAADEAPLPEPYQFRAIRQVWLGEGASRRLIVAPHGREIDAIRDLLLSQPEMAARIGIASPEQIRAAHLRQYAPSLTLHAVAHLRRTSPRLSAADALDLTVRAVALLFAGGLGLWLAPWLLLSLFDSLFLAAGGLRLVSAGSAWRLTAEPPPTHLELPTYAVLVPLFREAEVVADLVAALKRIDYPADLLSVILIVEADDQATREQAEAAVTGTGMAVCAVPPSWPRTKPKALTWALSLVDTELVAVFDAEDRPAPDQLREAAAAFAAGPRDLVCVQAVLDIDHADASANWLARQFTLEYRVLFRSLLPWLARQRLFLPIGGTSNHFRRDTLVAAGGWDPFNVTEDADLSIRLVRAGGGIATIASQTMEEAPLTWIAWHRQRTRWMKGWMQTWLVHMRRPLQLWSELGSINFLVFQVLILGQVLSALVFPISLCVVTAEVAGLFPMFADREFDDDLLLSYHLLALTAGWLGIVAAMLATGRSSGRRIRAGDLATLPVYWVLLFAAAVSAVVELLIAPHRWNKTRHGLAERLKVETPPAA